jgi:hypothetical protein
MLVHSKASSVLGTSVFTALLLALASASSACADQTIPLFTATSDAVAGVLSIGLRVTDDAVATGLYYATSSEENVIPLDGLGSGIVLYSASGHDVAILRSSDFDPATGGSLTLDYLYNGISGERRMFDFELDRMGTDWKPSVNDQAGRRGFTSLYLKAKRFLGQIIGIASITPR